MGRDTAGRQESTAAITLFMQIAPSVMPVLGFY